jgi:MFS family permease
VHTAVRQYGFSIALSALVVVVFSVAGWLVARASSRAGRPALIPVARVLAAGALLLILAATAVPHTWPPRLLHDGEVILTFGDGGLGDWRLVLHDPRSEDAVLFVLNVLLYIPLTMFGTIALPRRRLAILLGSLALSCLIEVVQFRWLGRVAAVDDVVLNMVGAVAGCIVGGIIVARSSGGVGALPRRRGHTIRFEEKGEGRG